MTKRELDYKQNSNWYHQIQGQLHVTRRKVIEVDSLGFGITQPALGYRFGIDDAPNVRPRRLRGERPAIQPLTTPTKL
ncbi:hypothetical protein EVAR_64175_1 [Eumeta japonica]|uniref:Uncharacterized protein n=1 Tax=Eumeta variegata TaxID=151549 RepID=A0A4C1ZTU2_EUMVA|nr:hypothetical protein EVAR_64175_1 [Eumeta japonica]